MAPDSRHLRARWIIAAAGWLLWLITIALPTGLSGSRHVWTIYPEGVRAASRIEFRVKTISNMVETAALIGFLAASCVLVVSPLLMGLNHSLNPAVRRWRWVGLGLLATLELTTMVIMQRGSNVPLSLHVFVLAHLILCVAIIPWPGEHAIRQSGFEVIIPDQRFSD